MTVFHDQLDQMLVKHNCHCYVEELYDRMVMIHPGGHSKHAIVQDEFLKLMNYLFGVTSTSAHSLKICRQACAPPKIQKNVTS